MGPAEKDKQTTLSNFDRRQAKAAAALAEANLAKAQLENEKLAAETDEWLEGKELRKKSAAEDLLKKQMANEAERRSWIADVVPDLSDVDPGSLEGADKPLFTAMLATYALNKAAAQVAGQLSGTVSAGEQVLLTADEFLTDRLALYNSVKNEITAAVKLIKSVMETFPSPEEIEAMGLLAAPLAASALAAVASAVSPVTIGAAAAALVPAVLPLFATKRTLTAAEVTQDGYLSMVAVAGALLAQENPPTVIMDDTRVLRGETEIEKAFTELYSQSLELTVAVESCETEDSDWLEKARATLSVARAVMETLTAADEKTGMNMLSLAASQEVLKDPELKHILVVTPAGSSTTQLVNDRPFMMKDRFNVFTTAAIAFVCVDPHTGHVKNAGISTDDAQLDGAIGDRIQFRDPEQSGNLDSVWS